VRSSTFKSESLDRLRHLTYSNFNLCSLHLDAILAAGPSFSHQLEVIELGDSETGKGSRVRDGAVIQLAKACPGLVHMSLAGTRFLTDASLSAIFDNCPHIRYLSITGNDRCTEDINGVSLEALAKNSALVPALGKLRLTDQETCNQTLDKACKSLSSARKRLAIEVGNTHERGGHVTTWLGGKQIDGYQAFEGPGGFSQYGGY
jgi:hypothetical protein